MSYHVWNVQRFSRDTVLRGLYAYCLARSGGHDHLQSLPPAESETSPFHIDYLPALRFAGYVMESIRQTGEVLHGKRSAEAVWLVRIYFIWAGAIRSCHRYARGKNQGNYELAGRKMLAAAIRIVYGEIHGGPEEQLWGLLLKLEETGDVLPVLRDYLEEHRYEECLLILEGSFRGYSYAKTTARSEDKPKKVQPDSVPTTADLDIDVNSH